MNKAIVIFVRCLLGSLAFYQADAWSQDVLSKGLCFYSVDGKARVELEFRIYSDRSQGWNGGYVRYRGSTEIIPIVLKFRDIEDPHGDGPWEATDVWLEIAKEAVNGEYQLITQGAYASLSYHRRNKPNKAYSFTLSGEAGMHGCP